MLVKMIHTSIGCQDGFIVDKFMGGKFYHIADSLAAEFIRRGKAVNQPLVDGCLNCEWYNVFYGE